MQQHLRRRRGNAKEALMCFVSAIRAFFEFRRIADRDALSTFMEGHAAGLVQKSIAEYTKLRPNMLFSNLLCAQPFLDGYEAVRWQSFPAAVSMVAEVIAGSLRERHQTAPGQLDAALAGIAGTIVSRYPLASRRSDAYWQGAADDVARDLALASRGAPRPMHAIPRLRAGEIFDLLPVPSQLRRQDFPVFLDIIGLQLAEIKADFESAAVPASLVASLSA